MGTSVSPITDNVTNDQIEAAIIYSVAHGFNVIDTGMHAMGYEEFSGMHDSIQGASYPRASDTCIEISLPLPIHSLA
jgi:hypothetical protein